MRASIYKQIIKNRYFINNKKGNSMTFEQAKEIIRDYISDEDIFTDNIKDINNQNTGYCAIFNGYDIEMYGHEITILQSKEEVIQYAKNLKN